MWETHQEGLGVVVQNVLGGLQVSGSPVATTPPGLGLTQGCTNLSWGGCTQPTPTPRPEEKRTIHQPNEDARKPP